MLKERIQNTRSKNIASGDQYGKKLYQDAIKAIAKSNEREFNKIESILADVQDLPSPIKEDQFVKLVLENCSMDFAEFRKAA